MAAYTNNTYQPVGRALNQAVGTTSTTKMHQLGTRAIVRDTSTSSNRGEAEVIYLQGVANVVEGTPCLIKDDYTTSTVAARDKGGIAFASAAIVANNYGWFFTRGTFVAAVATVTANQPLYIAAAGALLDDLAVAGDQVIGCRSNTATDTATCLVNCSVNACTADFDNT